MFLPNLYWSEAKLMLRSELKPLKVKLIILKKLKYILCYCCAFSRRLFYVIIVFSKVNPHKKIKKEIKVLHGLGKDILHVLS